MNGSGTTACKQSCHVIESRSLRSTASPDTSRTKTNTATHILTNLALIKVVVSVNEEYNPETDTWRDLMDIDVGRHGAAGGTIRGKIYVACGGPTGGSSYTDQVEVFGY